MNVKKTLLVLTIICFFSNYSSAQKQGIDNVVGEKFTISSKILGEDREIQVYLPKSYDDDGQKNYPVLYILDGQRYFLYGVGFQQTFTNFSKTPEFIVVGIENIYPQRFDLLEMSADKYLEFMEQEVLGFVDKNFRTADDRILFGWEYGGGFAIHVMAMRPDLFNAYFSASPFPLDYRRDPEADTRIKIMENLLSKGAALNKFLYFTLGKDEYNSLSGTDSLVGLLKKSSPKELNWKYDLLDDEKHVSTPYRTLYKGLERYYDDFEPIRFESIQVFNEAGGIKHVYEHYRKRGLRYGISTKIDDKTKFSLINTARTEDNYAQFDFFLNEFEDYIERSNFNINWGIRFGRFYLKHDNPYKAIKVFNTLSDKFPKSSKPHNALGDAFKAKGDAKQASKSYQKAIELVKENSDPNLSDYQAKLSGLKE